MIKYNTPVDPAVETTSHGLMLRLVGTGHDVLDVGCATGYLGREMQANGNRVSGVEQDPASAVLAEEHLDRVLVADLETADLVAEFGAENFDVLVFGDVLEHLRNPLDVLSRARRLLRPGGSVVVSIPNVAHGSIRLALLTGDWTYRSLGLLDNTHVSFFTRHSVNQLLRRSGLVAVERLQTIAPPLAVEVTVDAAVLPPGTLEYVEADPDSWTYQFVWRAVRDDANSALATRVSELETTLVQYRETASQAEAARAAAEQEAQAANQRAAQAAEQLVEQAARAREQVAVATQTAQAGAAGEAELQRSIVDLLDQLREVHDSRTMRVARRARSVLVVLGLRPR